VHPTPDTLKARPQPQAHRWGQYRVDEFTSCECALPNDSPSTGETWVDVDSSNETAVRAFFVSIQQRNRQCYASKKWSMEGTDGSMYNTLDYLGSNVLDLDLIDLT
jgi:hypothetical protein